MIVTVTPTVMSGTVVRFYEDEGAEKFGSPHVSASRDKVLVHGTVEVNAWLFDAIAGAQEAHERIKNGGDVEDLATHRRGILAGRLLPVGNEPQDRAGES